MEDERERREFKEETRRWRMKVLIDGEEEERQRNCDQRKMAALGDDSSGGTNMHKRIDVGGIHERSGRNLRL